MAKKKRTVSRDCIEIDNKILQVGVLSNPDGKYQAYLYPGMTINETAFCMMVLIRLLEKGGHVTKDAFIGLVEKYYNDEKYSEVKPDGQN